VGPNYTSPPVNLSKSWLAEENHQIKVQSQIPPCWWRVFNDPVLNRLIEMAYRENLSLEQAGFRVLEARAQLGIAVGEFYPQQQQAFGSIQRIQTSASNPAGGSTSLARTLGTTAAQSAVRSAVGNATANLLNTPPNQNQLSTFAGVGGTQSTG